MKNRFVYAILAVLFGCLGINNFYAGNWGKGIIKIVLTLTCIGAIATTIWSYVEAFVVSKDANGGEMSDPNPTARIIASLVLIVGLFLLNIVSNGILLPILNSVRDRAASNRTSESVVIEEVQPTEVLE